MAGSTYVQISREELEEWLNSIGFHGKWERDSRYAGIYLLKIGPAVAVKLSSTIGGADDAKERGKASMQLSLVSSVTGRVLNKKAQGQDHFKRTLNWKKTWAAGIDTMKKAYLSSADFYEAIAVIADREAYKIDHLKEIEGIPGWDNDSDLIRLYRKLENNGVLMGHELDLISDAKKRPVQPTPDPQRVRSTGAPGEGQTFESPDQRKESRLSALRKLYAIARRNNDEWTMNFAEDIAKKWVMQGRALTGPQLRIVSEKMSQYRIPDDRGGPAHNLF